MTNPPRADTPAVVLDTNVALDWLVFADPVVAVLAQRIESGAWRWLACERMRGELAQVLTRAPFSDRGEDGERALALFDRFARRVPTTDAPARHPAMRCRDPDDQVFVDVAAAHGARWLFTRDKALLALAPQALRLGLEIVSPRDWSPDAPPPQ